MFFRKSGSVRRFYLAYWGGHPRLTALVMAFIATIPLWSMGRWVVGTICLITAFVLIHTAYLLTMWHISEVGKDDTLYISPFRSLSASVAWIFAAVVTIMCFIVSRWLIN